MKTLFKLSFLMLSLLSIANAIETPTIYTAQKTHITITTAQPQFIIQLKSNPTTGFSWFLKKYNPQWIQPIKHHFQAPDNPKLIGAPGYELWTFKVKPEGFTKPLQTSMIFVYQRPWEKTNPATKLTFWISTII